MGEDIAEFSRRLTSLQQLTVQSASSGKPVDATLLDERPLSQVKVTNLLADLTSREFTEQDFLLVQQRSDASMKVGTLHSSKFVVFGT